MKSKDESISDKNIVKVSTGLGTFLAKSVSSIRSKISYLSPRRAMDQDYTLNEILGYWFKMIGPSSKEKEVQAFWENLLWTVFPAAKHWSVVTKYQQGSTEPDNKVMQIQNFEFEDVLTIELKRLKENPRQKDFDRVLEQLDKHMTESGNPAGTILYGAVGIGHHVCFYKKVLPSQPVQGLHPGLLHLLKDSDTIQRHFEEMKTEAGWAPWVWTEQHNSHERWRMSEGSVLWQYRTLEGEISERRCEESLNI